MANRLFYIDDTAYDIKLVGITRTVSEHLQYEATSAIDGARHRHVMGRYITYTLTFPDYIPASQSESYAELYDALTEVTDWHTFKLPYNNSLLTFEGSVEGDITDTLNRATFGSTLSTSSKYTTLKYGLWGGLTFTIKSRYPYMTE